jgi:catechol-2,3-dioxygenase
MSETPTGESTAARGDLPIIKPTLHHVQLKTTQLQEMKRWYQTVVGLEVQFEFELGAFLFNDEANHRIVLIQTPKLFDDPDKWSRTGMEHTAFEYDGLEDLLSSHARLKAQGIEPFICLDHGLTTSFYYEDPDRNSVELQADNFGNWAQSSAFMRSDEFRRDPIGTQVDPEKLADALGQGVPREEIRTRSRRGDYLPEKLGELHIPV